jgi:hypothetical protein
MDSEVPPSDLPPPPSSVLVGVGCLTAFSGLFAGGMIAVLLGKIVGSLRGCQPLEGTPACNWNVYAAVGMLFGAVVFPTISIIRLKSRRS